MKKVLLRNLAHKALHHSHVNAHSTRQTLAETDHLHVLLRAQTYSTTSSDNTRGDKSSGRSWQTLFCVPRKCLVSALLSRPRAAPPTVDKRRDIDHGLVCVPAWRAQVRLENGGLRLPDPQGSSDNRTCGQVPSCRAQRPRLLANSPWGRSTLCCAFRMTPP
ncbi:hypothetical protein PHLGIDRAFT_20449 [Phlebiopsis gigantea 11061_1 CR5-6]|uniref:Uncharacterized protein n=1 Tax=Phlebiopsis gigantea (strain 11061_1 CR5-6) TaxID=745531 RepID=A0A0C3S3N0_PHLG1|nr:hypothetical protein PHLGIDRAFT_20449 [Phlebiopsis gigantea 11061_1 CR5-6]